MGVSGPNRVSAATYPANVGTPEYFALPSLRGKLGGLHACGATFRYTVPLPNIFLTPLFSKTRLKRKDFQEIARLAWAQEAPGSNPGAPTIYQPNQPTFFVLRIFVSLLVGNAGSRIQALLASTGLKQDSKIKLVRLRRGHPDDSIHSRTSEIRWWSARRGLRRASSGRIRPRPDSSCARSFRNEGHRG